MSSGVQLSGNEMLNKKVLSSRRNVRNDETVRRETGRVFHARAAATGNARSPRLDRLVAGTDKVTKLVTCNEYRIYLFTAKYYHITSRLGLLHLLPSVGC